ncbi:glycoside hydrolase [Spartinivicinus ruber]|uniref:glycoside hydrolase n=1 Tax=Spartinivicinus ruber TaxID=2683272 RepID=UPI0013D206E9|nr:glycoside hydrolase [Spartinivicinus ruber]
MLAKIAIVNKHIVKQFIILRAIYGFFCQALSKPVIEALQTAKLNKLLLLTPSWTPAFYHPEAVTAAKQAGYLIGTYDSYNTAIPMGVNDNWLTAQIPSQLRENCAIVKKDGHKKMGFQGKGVYTNPKCMQAYFQQRSTKIMRYGGFNSLFLDADATGMLYEDYQPKRLHSQSTMAKGFNYRLQWFVDRYQVPLGSEDGNAINTSSILFAHGIQTMGFGWLDPDMRKNKQSPYYLGAWWPDDEPQVFFKPVQVKAPYKDLLFAPEYKLPLYQAVFHDAVINGFHWGADSLKFTDVKVVRDLTAMLYNTPPMLHISRNSLKKRLPVLKHYAKGFQLTHEKLWDKTLVKFVDLTKNRQVQQTMFSDGSTITANFSSKDYLLNKQVVKPNMVVMHFSDGSVFNWKSN